MPLSQIHVYLVVSHMQKGGVSMCHYRRYMYIWSSAIFKRVASVCAIITDTGIYCHQRQFMQTTIYADDNSCNMYCHRRQFMQATIYAVTPCPFNSTETTGLILLYDFHCDFDSKFEIVNILISNNTVAVFT